MLWTGVQITLEMLERIKTDPSLVQAMLNKAAGATPC